MDARVTAKTDRLGRDTIYYFNENNRLTRTVYPDGSEVRYEYDDQNNRTLVVDELGLATRTAYNTNNDPVQITDPQGNITRITYGRLWGHPLKGLLSRKRLRHPRKNRFFLPEQSCQVLYALIVSTFPHPLFRRFCVSDHTSCTQSPIRIKAAVELRRA
jgi:YD repeat-containing protein